jgi:hypothetical protein
MISTTWFPTGVVPLTSVSRRPGSTSMVTVAFRLHLLTIALIAVASAYARISGVGSPPYHAVPEPSELARVHRLVGLALFAVAALAAALFASAFVFLILGWHRSRVS